MTVLQARPVDELVPPWDMHPVARALYDRLAPLASPDPDNGWAFAALIDGYARVLTELDDANTPDWSAVLNPDRCPWWALRWCGQVYGLRLTPMLDPWVRADQLTEERWRQAIRDRTNWRRGTPNVVLAAVRSFLATDTRLRLLERTQPGETDDKPYRVTLRVPLDDIDDQYIAGTRAGTNLVQNPALTPGLDGWAGKFATIARSTSTPGIGTYALRVQGDSAGPFFDDIVSDDVGELVGEPSSEGPQGWAPAGVHNPGTRMHAAAVVRNPEVVPVRVALRLETGGLWPQLIGQTFVTLSPGQVATVELDAIVPPVPEWDDTGLDIADWDDITTEFADWLALVMGHPTWASLVDISCRLVLSAPYDPATGQPIVGGAVYWADPHVNTGLRLSSYGHGDLDGWDWAGVPYASVSSRPDTRSSPAVVRAFKAALPIGLIGHTDLSDGEASWDDVVRVDGTWGQVVTVRPSWQAVLETLYDEVEV